ncbi:MAG: hypothetical protein ACOY5Y_07025 [Pseudomonadota bacterium]
MADLVITATSVAPSATTKQETGVAGEAITAGQVVYRDASTGKYGLADCDSATAGHRSPVGIALHGAAANQPLVIAKSGPMTLGATLTAGVAYYLSPTAGGVCPVADLGSGDYPVFLGFATSAALLDVDIVEAGVALA